MNLLRPRRMAENQTVGSWVLTEDDGKILEPETVDAVPGTL